MKHILLFKTLVLLFVVYLCMPSCAKYEFLDKPPGTDVTEDTVFNTVKDFEKFLAGTYMYGMHSYYPYHNTNGSVNPNPTMCMTAPITDEAEMSHTWHTAQIWNSGSIVKNNIINDEDKRFNLRWKAIRRCNIIIERMPTTEFTTAEKNRFTGEALFIRALNNFEMLKRYGGMPIVNKRLTETDDWNIPRATFADYVDYIVKDCSDAATLLDGVTYADGERGRVNKAACLALKAKVLLYAASPLFNTATPYISSSVDQLVCYGNYDKNRWKLAADAAKDALDAAAALGFSILDTDSPETDYRDMWQVFDNQEVILAEKFLNKTGNWSHPWALIVPTGMGMSTWGNAVCVPHNHIRKYEKMDGTPQTWNAPGVRGSDLMEKYAELDPRFRQTVSYNGSAWNNQYQAVQYYQGGTVPTPEVNITGALMHKIIPYQLAASGGEYQMHANGILFRVGELYLTYAEAMNEYSGPTKEVYDAIHVIRDRAGMPDYPAGLTQEQMRDRIKNERDIELCYEDHRMWDIRRWMDAEKDGVMQGAFYKVTIWNMDGNDGLNQKCDYEISQYETRTFHRKMYLHPIQENEVNKGYMVQNPGW